MTVLAAKIFRKLGWPKLAAVAAAAATKLRPRSASALAEYCANRMEARDFDAIAARCAAASRQSRLPPPLADAATAWLTRSRIEDDADPEMLARLRSPVLIHGAAASQAFAGGDNARGREEFASAVLLAGAPEATLPDWLAAFDAAAAASGSAQPPALHAKAKLLDPVPKIIVSGMYWSGSGALYAYFREFDDVAPVEGELRLWKEGDFCLNALHQAYGGDGFGPALFRFLTLALAGTAPVAAWRETLAAKYARDALRSDADGGYARACRKFAEAAAEAAFSRSGDSDGRFLTACKRLSEDLSRRWSGAQGGTVLLDNVVHIADAGAGRLFDNARVLCVFRDPRSNFVARWRENPRFHRDVGRYIDYYRDVRARFDAALAEDAELASFTRPVSFERFILSEDYRESLARQCGLDPARRSRRGTHFRPEASLKNVSNYLDFADREAIARIERELGEYCVDPETGMEASRG